MWYGAFNFRLASADSTPVRFPGRVTALALAVATSTTVLLAPVPAGPVGPAAAHDGDDDIAVAPSDDLDAMWSSGWLYSTDGAIGPMPDGAGVPHAIGLPQAAGEAWTLPSMPSKCTDAQKLSGNVAGCLLDGPTGLPEAAGWPTPPFPEPADGAVIPWVELAVGAQGHVVADVQQALIASGATTLVADGDFGSRTEAAVRDFQTKRSLPVTGRVDQATADALGVQNHEQGPFPPAGWTWLGWGYNGSAALAGWESLLVHNTSSISGASSGTIRVGAIRTMPEILPLYEGFLREIMAGGYSIREAGSYVFRCTSNSGKPCNGLGRSSLSNHAYGLALDVNTVANPERTYSGLDGATACSTPMATDIPQWVVQTAERWGLYWGGYGWSGGCSTPAQVKSSILRDPMHFEFRGTPEQARAIAARNTTGPRYCADVASNAGTVNVICTPGSMPVAGWRMQVSTGAPQGATAALVNITANEATGEGYLTAESCGTSAGGIRQWSNGNFAKGETTANVAMVPVDSAGRFCVFISSATHVIVDVQGFLLPSDKAGSQGRLFTMSGPQRIADTRSLGYCTAAGACTKAAPVPSGTHTMLRAPAVAATASAVLANLTVTGPTATGYLTADTCASLAPGEQTRSNVNFVAGQTVANLGMVPLDGKETTAFCTYASAPTHSIVDVLGVFAPASAGGWAYTSLPQKRLADTRVCYTEPGGQQACGARRTAGSITRVQGPAGAAAAVVNLTLAEASAAGYATAGPCSTMTSGLQPYSNINVVPNDTAANLAVVQLDSNGQFCIYTSTPTHLIVDLQGSFASGTGQQFVPVTPRRTLDTRAGGVPLP